MKTTEAIEKFQSDISDVITRQRILMGLTQNDLAEIMGVFPDTVNEWESGNTYFTLEMLVKICSRLDIGLEVKITPRQKEVNEP